MNSTTPLVNLRALLLGGVTLAAASVAGFSPAVQAQTLLADSPPFASPIVPGNVAFPLSVEYPTVQRAAYTDPYVAASTYLGYFDANKCYTYHANSGDNVVHPTSANMTSGSVNYFQPAGSATTHACSGKWSGNFLNWAATPTIDPFRWSLTGGYRVVDTTTLTVLEKAWSDGHTGLFPDKSISTTATVSGATPFSANSFTVSIDGLGNKMRFTTGTISGTVTTYDGTQNTGTSTYEAYARARVCDSTAANGGVESNCVQYGSNWKPQGLIQTYANKMRFSVFGYLNNDDELLDGGVLRAGQKFVGPTMPVPGSLPTTNTLAEWDASTGVMAINPNPADATQTNSDFAPSTSVTNSGVMNYLNKFGEIAPTASYTFKSHDPVSELYYTAVRYFKALGNVASYTSMTGATAATKTTWIDGFPVIQNWTDPIQYSCQKNFILGIGDVNTWDDKNLPGSPTGTNNEPTKPTEVVNDTTVDSVAATTKAFALEGLGTPSTTSYSGRNNSAGIVGLAYDSHTKDIRPSMPGMRIDTYWVDVLENGFLASNQFYLAAKYGGFTVPTGYDPYNNTTALPESWWHTPAGSPDTNLVGTQKRPDNYFTGGRPDLMIAGLNAAFSKIASQLTAFTTSGATALPQLASTGNASYGASFDAATWTGDVLAYSLGFSGTTAAQVQQWSFKSLLVGQLQNSGWDTNRRIATWNGTKGVQFCSTGATTTCPSTSQITAAQLTALDPSYTSASDGLAYLKYLRGDGTNEQASTASGTTSAYRTRAFPMGDIVGSALTAWGPPAYRYSDATNPGYANFKATWASRPTVLYVGANDGMMHAIRGDLTGSLAGSEMFAYVPSALFQGPNATPSVDGLASIGNPSFTHHYFVNATPQVFDIDFAKTSGATGTTDWHTVLIGGLGKGGKSYYAIDVTDPVTMSASEANVAAKVLWEFSDADLGYSFGDPVVVKTAKYGWVVIFASGYNATDGKGHLLIVNPKTGVLLEKVSTGVGAPTTDAGLAFATAFVVDGTDGTADAVYAGDLQGNLWRWDVTAASGTYPAPLKIALLKDGSGAVQPVTTAPEIEVDQATKRRTVLVGTGRMLDTSDTASTQIQDYYAIFDGTNGRFNSSTDLPSGVTFPILRANLAPDSSATSISASGISFTSTQMGFYIDLGLNTASGYAYRVVTGSSTLLGSVFFAATAPTGGVCTPAGSSNGYGIAFGTGKTQFVDSSGNPLANITISGTVTNIKAISLNGNGGVLFGDNNNNITFPPTVPLGTPTVKRLNWRELQDVN